MTSLRSAPLVLLLILGMLAAAMVVRRQAPSQGVTVSSALRVTITDGSDAGDIVSLADGPTTSLYMPMSAAELRAILAQLSPEALLQIAVVGEDGNFHALRQSDLGAERSCISDAEAWAYAERNRQ